MEAAEAIKNRSGYSLRRLWSAASTTPDCGVIDIDDVSRTDSGPFGAGLHLVADGQLYDRSAARTDTLRSSASSRLTTPLVLTLDSGPFCIAWRLETAKLVVALAAGQGALQTALQFLFLVTYEPRRLLATDSSAIPAPPLPRPLRKYAAGLRERHVLCAANVLVHQGSYVWGLS